MTSPKVDCPDCGGIGRVWKRDSLGIYDEECLTCEGSGWVEERFGNAVNRAKDEADAEDARILRDELIRQDVEGRRD
jgi:DnaJ-class molecular chaperone